VESGGKAELAMRSNCFFVLALLRKLGVKSEPQLEADSSTVMKPHRCKTLHY